MASKVLPQVLLLVPGNHPTQSPPLLKKQLVFSFHASRRLSLSNARASSNLFGPIFGTAHSRNSFLVRAEADEAVDSVDTAVAEEDELPEENSEAEAEAEPRAPFKPRVKLGDVMGILNNKAVAASNELRPVADIRTGDIVQIKLEVPENRRRQSIYKGIVISRQNAGIHTTIRVRRIIAGCGVEIVFPLYSPNVKEIKVVAHRKVRKARLYYLRDKLPRLSTFK